MIRFLKKQWLRILICFLVVASCIVVYNIFNSYENQDTGVSFNAWKSPIAYSNALFIGGLTTIGIGGLSLVSKAGGFDIYSYMVAAKRKENGKKETLYDYSERMSVKRKKRKFEWAIYFSFGILEVIISLLLLI